MRWAFLNFNALPPSAALQDWVAGQFISSFAEVNSIDVYEFDQIEKIFGHALNQFDWGPNKRLKTIDPVEFERRRASEAEGGLLPKKMSIGIKDEDLRMKATNAAGDEKAKTVVANDPGDSKGTVKHVGGSQSAHFLPLGKLGPMPALHGVVRWRLIDLAHWLFEELQISISKQTLSRELRNMGFRRPRRHAQDEEAAEVFKKASPPSWRKPQHKAANQ
jgi:hypothetical protein